MKNNTKNKYLFISLILTTILLLNPLVLGQEFLKTNELQLPNRPNSFDVTNNYIAYTSNLLSLSSQYIATYNTNNLTLIHSLQNNFDGISGLGGRIGNIKIIESEDLINFGTSRRFFRTRRIDSINSMVTGLDIPNRLSQGKYNNDLGLYIASYNPSFSALSNPYGFNIYNISNNDLLYENKISEVDNFGGFSPVSISPLGTRFAFASHSDYDRRLIILDETYSTLINISLSIGDYRDIEFIDENRLIISTSEVLVVYNIDSEVYQIIESLSPSNNINVDYENNLFLVNQINNNEIKVYDFSLNLIQTIEKENIISVIINDNIIYLLDDINNKIHIYEIVEDIIINTLSPTNVKLSSAIIRGEILNINNPVNPSFLYRKSGEVFFDEYSFDISVTTPNIFSYELTNLEPLTFYDYRFKVEDLITNEIVIGGVNSFFTSEIGLNEIKVFPNNLRTGLMNTYEIDLKNYVTEFTNISLQVKDTINQISFNLETEIDGEEVVRGTPSYIIRLIPDGETIKLRFTSSLNEFIFPSKISFIKSANSMNYNFNFVVSEEETLSKIKDFSDFVMGFNQVKLLSNNNFFTGYESILLNTVNPVTLEEVNLNVNINGLITSVYDSEEFKISLIPFSYSVGSITNEDIRIKIESKNVNVSNIDFEIIATKEDLELGQTFNQVSNFNVEINELFSLDQQPIIYKNVPDIFLNYGETRSIKFNDFFVNNTYNEVEFYFEGIGITIIINENNKVYEDNFIKIELIGEELFFTGKNLFVERTGIMRTYLGNQFINTNQFNIVVGTDGKKDDVSSLILGILPKAEDITIGQRYLYVVLTLFVVSLFILGLSREQVKLGLYLSMIASFFIIIFYVSIGYIGIGIIILLALLGIASSVLFYKRGGNT